MKIIELKNINKVYGKGESESKVLRNVNLAVDKGELIAIMGPSGAGKSTLLNILGCIDVPSSGQYYLDGNDISMIHADGLALIRNVKIGFVFQNFNLLYDFSLIDNVGMPLTYSKDKKKIKERAIESLKSVGLEDHAKKTPKELSGGQKQRVAIARALVTNPEVILADEPTGALDKENGEKILEMLLEINKRGKTVIIITHDINVANRCNKIMKIIDGVVTID